jgi:hypothetical protein
MIITFVKQCTVVLEHSLSCIKHVDVVLLSQGVFNAYLCVKLSCL